MELYNKKLASRLMLGTALYPSPDHLKKSVEQSGCSVVTVSLRREANISSNTVKDTDNFSGNRFWSLIKALNVNVLPNTAGCHSVKEAIITAHMAREVFQTPWIKLEVIGNHDTLQPNIFELVEAAKILCDEGFHVFPYTTDDLIVAEKLLDAGCKVLMPWGAPIGSGLGLYNPYALKTLRHYFPDIPLIIDAGLGLPSHAAHAMELGYDGILLNTAIAKAGDPARMAKAFSLAIDAGRSAYEADPIEPRNMASPSTPLLGKAFS